MSTPGAEHVPLNGHAGRHRLRRVLQIGADRAAPADLRADRRPASLQGRGPRRVRGRVAPLAQGVPPRGPGGVGAAGRLAARPAPPLHAPLPPRPQARPRDPRHAGRAGQAAVPAAQDPAAHPARRRLDDRHGARGRAAGARRGAQAADRDVAVRDAPRRVDGRHPEPPGADPRSRRRRALAPRHDRAPGRHDAAAYAHRRRSGRRRQRPGAGRRGRHRCPGRPAISRDRPGQRGGRNQRRRPHLPQHRPTTPRPRPRPHPSPASPRTT